MEQKKTKSKELEYSLLSIILNEQKFIDIYGSKNIHNKICAFIYKSINENSFVEEDCKKLFLITKQLFVKDIPITFFKVTDLLEKNLSFSFDNASKLYYKYEGYNTIFDEENANHIIKSIIDSYRIKEVRNTLKEVDISVKKENLQEIYIKIENLFNSWNSSQQYDLVELSSIVKSTLKQIEKSHNSKKFCTGITSGYDSLDQITRGFQPGNFIILAARPSFGKTALAINFVKNLIFDEKMDDSDAILFFNLEMSKQEISKRFLSLMSGIDSNRIELSKLSKVDMSILTLASVRLEKAPIYINESSNLSIENIILISRDMNRRKNIKLIVIDYLQLVDSDVSRNMNREQQVSKISRNLKLLANSLNCPIIALSQLSRKTESRENKRPLMSDLRESGSLEQDADLIMFLYREDYYKKHEKNDEENLFENNDTEVIDLIVSKNRQGSLKTIKFNFFKKICTFQVNQ